MKTCHIFAQLKLIRIIDGKERGVEFHFEFRDRSQNEIREEIITLSTHPTLLSTVVGSTTISSRLNYFPDSSARTSKTSCYPDFSALSDANNFQRS